MTRPRLALQHVRTAVVHTDLVCPVLASPIIGADPNSYAVVSAPAQLGQRDYLVCDYCRARELAATARRIAARRPDAIVAGIAA